MKGLMICPKCNQIAMSYLGLNLLAIKYSYVARLLRIDRKARCKNCGVGIVVVVTPKQRSINYLSLGFVGILCIMTTLFAKTLFQVFGKYAVLLYPIIILLVPLILGYYNWQNYTCELSETDNWRLTRRYY